MVKSLTRRRLATASLLAAIAGYIDGFGFLYLGGYFVSFMSGNTTRASVDLSTASLPAAASALLLIGCFVAGAMAGTAMPRGHGRGPVRVLAMVLTLVCVAAAVAAGEWRWAAGGVLAFAMGAMNTVFAQDGDIPFGVTYMTGALVKLGQGLVRAARGEQHTGWQRQLLMWASIACGAVLGAAALGWLGAAALWVVAAVLVVMLAVPALRRSLGSVA
ncbi:MULTISPECIES: YoaK family protein [Microbacterium]|uniref:DUF1275 domain-containing protein n=1 Tax=Microbacterium wangchenii TaxID=2541726 RepID=A0ABX5STS0_9MICO|nr:MULTISPECIES: YoaK family protein [Microbacterium]MCK6065110.1 DUF1275 domain-containing protein [Microbacterium sp. EYE_512]QBR88567.1 DUF1275 domain-containing protein [Microbacterium wangchenii]TFV82378.1 DUF1275 domain-containing protein [Microbacterium sp. dk485]TXK20293.1 DUF1275 domain-containing protein [Microbacterium wangchenii]